MAKGLNRRMDAAEGGKRRFTGIHITGDGAGNFNVVHHYEGAGSTGLGENYQEKPRTFATGKDMLSHVSVHASRLGRSAPKDEREEEDNYDAQGGDENER